MAIPDVKKEDILNALKYIDENGVPFHNQSMKYDLVSDDGKRYPLKYVIAVAHHLANGADISVEGIPVVETRNFLEGMGFTIETKQQAKEHSKEHGNSYVSMLLQSKNLIFHGAPGTGKSYLAREIAARIVSGGACDRITDLSDAQKKQVEFVQFHPGYDYADFVEGLRPRLNDDGTMGFELQDGIFKKFVARARKNDEDSQKTEEVLEKETTAQEAMTDFFSNIDFDADTFKTVNGREFSVTGVDDKYINIYIPDDVIVKRLVLKLDDIRKMLESGQGFSKVKDVWTFFGKPGGTRRDSYIFALYKEIKKRMTGVSSRPKAKREELKKYVFIIDEINRGEISKIFGELFFAIDPGYRGRAGEVSTQYANMHDDPNEKFYIPENVYIIGTMNDIDRSVDSFDFAMRRRFRFVKLSAADRLEMLDDLGDKKEEAVHRMTALNRQIADTEDLGDNYQIGPAYFLKLRALDFDFDRLWTDDLEPLLREYVQGMYDEKGSMERFAKAYGYDRPEDDENEAAEDQG